jgi:threonine synthase
VANAMDVGAPSNFERLRWTFPNAAQLRQALRAESVDDDTIRATALHHAREHGEIVCPHTATAFALLDRETAHGDPWVVVATAHPAKFETVLEPLLGHRLAVPPALAWMLERSASAEALAADDAALKQWLRERAEARTAGPA